MAGKKENLKALFSNTRTRVIILFTVILLVITIIIGFVKFYSSTSPLGSAPESGMRRSPYGIKSIPGALNQNAEYARLQEEQNINQAEHASKTGNSAIPTIISTKEFGEGIESVGAKHGEGSVGFDTLAREDLGGAQNSLWLQSLQDTNCSKASVAQVISQGATLDDLKAGCSCLQLKSNGYGINDLKSICSCKDLRAAGFGIQDLKVAGFTAQKLRLCGFVACEEHGAGFSAQEMKDGGYSDGELKGAGFTDRDIARAGGLPDGMTADDVRKVGCSPDALSRLRNAGVTAAAIRRISGCSVNNLKAAGFSVRDLRNAGFSAADLKNAGFTPSQLRAAGYDARDLLNAGFMSDDLAAAGFSPVDIKTAENELPTNMTAGDVKDAGCDPETLKRERLAGVSATLIRKHANCSAQVLKMAGFTPTDLRNAGFRAADISAAGPIVNEGMIRAAGCSPNKLRGLIAQGVTAKQIHELNGCAAQALKEAGFDAHDLLQAGFTPQDLSISGFSPAQVRAGQLDDNEIRQAGCNPEQLKALLARGVSAKRIHQLNGCSAQALKNAGFDAKALNDAGFTPQALLAAGFNPEDIRTMAAAIVPVTDKKIRAAGCDPAKLGQLLEQGVSAQTIHQANHCDAATIKAAGFNAKALADAGFTPAELLAAGFAPEQLMQAGMGLSPAGVIAAGRQTDCSVASLKAARALNVSTSTIKQTIGCSAQAMKEAGYPLTELKNAGFTAAELLNAGFSPESLKGAGFGARELRAAGVSAQMLKNLNFSAEGLSDAGFSPEELKTAGFNVAQLKAAGLTAAQLKAAGFGASDLRKAGYSVKDLKEAGFGATALKNAGVSNQDLRDAGFSSQESSLAGLEALETTPSAPSTVATVPSINNALGGLAANQQAANSQQLEKILDRQQKDLAEQRYQQEIQKRKTVMMTAANQSLQGWKSVPAQHYQASTIKEKETVLQAGALLNGGVPVVNGLPGEVVSAGVEAGALIKTGDVLFAVIDTSVNSDEAGPILATIVSGKLKGSKLIGTFNLPSNADKMVISFNTLSVPGAAKTISISAFAVDPSTARTALSSQTDHHYLERYGSLFAATFLEGFGNAFQSADTTITVGGTGDVANTTVQNGVGRSALENAVIGLATVGKSWGQVAQQNMSRPTTVQVYSGTGIGVLFTQDLATI